MILKKANNYDEIVINEDFVALELGGHKGIIKKVEEYTSQISGNTSLKVEVDTDKDDKQPNYYQEQYDNNTNMNKKWSTGATKYVSLKEDENCIKMLKAFITAVENSNANFTYDWNKDTDQLIGKKVGLVFGLEEYQDQEGKTKTATKLTQFRSLDKVDNVKIPKVKLLDGTFVDYEEYKNGNSSTTPFNNLVETTDDDIPFEI
jgi:hypothetical protein